MASEALKRSFGPVVDANTRLLVLGSLPGERSLAREQYYAHPLNQFWRLIGSVIDADLVSLAYDARLEALLAARVGLWDVVASAYRRGSLDVDIRAHEANDLASLVRRLPALRAVAFNGGTSSKIGRKALAGEKGVALVDLPSSSPAYTLALEDKREAWGVLKPILA